MRGHKKYNLDGVKLWINCAYDKKREMTCITVDTLTLLFPCPIIMSP